MNTTRYSILALLLVSGNAFPGTAGEPHFSFLYSLPADGEWAEFEVEFKTLLSNSTGTLRISSVGQKTIKDAPHRWIELKIDLVTETKRKEKELSFLKLLVAEKAVEEGRSLKGQIAEAYGRGGQDGPVRRLESEDDDKLSLLGVTDAEVKVELVKDKEVVAAKLGEFTTRHLAFTMKMGGPKGSRADVWLSPEVPFGWLKAEGNTLWFYKLVATKKGKDAKSELDESKAEK